MKSIKMRVVVLPLERHHMNLIEQEPTPIPDYRIAYAAGYFDGEGCINVSANGDGTGNSLQLHVIITSGDKPTLLLFQELFGGTFHPRAMRRYGWKYMFTWKCSGSVALEALHAMLPFLIAKREQAQLVFDKGWNVCLRGKTLTPTDRFNRATIGKGLKALKRKGYMPHDSARSL